MAGVPVDCRRKRTGDIVDVDAIEDLPRFDDAARRAAPQVVKHAPLRPIDTSQAEDFDARPTLLSAGQPGGFGLEPAQAALRAGARRARFVDPRPLPIAINPHA